MWISDFLFSRQGRFGRLHWWATLLFWLIIIAFASKAGAAALGIPGQDCATQQTPGSTIKICMTTWRVLVPMMLALALVSTPPMTKRLHDRNRSSVWVFVYLLGFFAPLLAISLAGPEPLVDPSPTLQYVFKAAWGLVLLIAAVTIVDLGILRGTKGPNAYGDEPKHFSDPRG